MGAMSVEAIAPGPSLHAPAHTNAIGPAIEASVIGSLKQHGGWSLLAPAVASTLRLGHEDRRRGAKGPNIVRQNSL